MNGIQIVTSAEAAGILSSSRRRRFAPDERSRLRERAVEAYGRTESGVRTSKEIGVSVPVVYALLREANVELRGGTSFRIPKHQKPEAERLAILYYSRQRKKSCMRVSKRLKREGFDVSDMWVWTRIRAAGLINGEAYKRGAPSVVDYVRTDGTTVTLYLRGSHSADVVREALTEYEACGSPTLIAERLKVSISTLEKWAERAGLSRDSREAARVRIIRERGVSPAWRQSQVGALYTDERLSTTEIARRFGVSSSVIWHDLKTLGIEMRPRSESQRYWRYDSADGYDAFLADVARMRDENRSGKAIADATGRSYPTVKRAFDELDARAAAEAAAKAEADAAVVAARIAAYEADRLDQIAAATSSPTRFARRSLAERLRDGGHLRVRRVGAAIVEITLVDADGTVTLDQSATSLAGVLQLPDVVIEGAAPVQVVRLSGAPSSATGHSSRIAA